MAIGKVSLAFPASDRQSIDEFNGNSSNFQPKLGGVLAETKSDVCRPTNLPPYKKDPQRGGCPDKNIVVSPSRIWYETIGGN